MINSLQFYLLFRVLSFLSGFQGILQSSSGSYTTHSLGTLLGISQYSTCYQGKVSCGSIEAIVKGNLHCLEDNCSTLEIPIILAILFENYFN